MCTLQIAWKSEVDAVERKQIRWPASHVNAPGGERAPEIPTLWITGRSTALKQKLLTLRELPSTTIISPETDCGTDFLTPQTTEVIGGYIVRRGVCCVVVGGEADDVGVHPAGGNAALHDKTSPYGRISRRIADRSAQRRRVQDRIRAWLKHLRSDALISAVCRKRAIRLVGMLYIPECDAFLVYDRRTDQFLPLMEAISHNGP